jgi:hypothetical protein
MPEDEQKYFKKIKHKKSTKIARKGKKFQGSRNN